MQAPQDFHGLVYLFLSLINLLLPILVSVAFLVFVWGIIVFIKNSGDAKSHADGRQFLIWSVITLTVLVSFMAITRVLSNDLGFTYPVNGIPQLPVN